MATTTQIFFCTMTGFAFALYEFKSKGLIFSIILQSLMIPRFLNIIPLFKMMVTIKWIDTYLPLVVPPIANAFGVFMMTEFIKTGIPVHLMDSARIDGLNGFQILMKIVFPTMSGPIGIMGTVMFITSWNDFMTAPAMLPSKNSFTIPVILHSMNGNLGARGGHGTIMLATAISFIPLMIVFLIFSGKIIDNFVAGSLKG
ncbi:MAG: carbohydrate ABC transporter permease [Spirochaetales bacterium]|nr:carbohydrate ABC transporter permease [Spirochaetales bacterium]